MQIFSGKVAVAATLLLLTSAVHAQVLEKCAGSAKGSQEYREAADAVFQLPEFKDWLQSHRQPVVLGDRVDKKVPFEDRCYWSVSVYAGRGARLEMWHVFLVGDKGREIYIDDGEGETLSLNQWRKKHAQSARPASSVTPGGR